MAYGIKTKPKTRKTYDVYSEGEPVLNFETKEQAKSFMEERTKLKDPVWRLDPKTTEIKEKTSKSYVLGERWRGDFDYDGMIATGTEADSSWSVKKLDKLFDSYEDVNYHRESRPLYEAIELLKKGNKNEADIKLNEFREINKNLLKEWKTKSKKETDRIDFQYG